MYYSKKSIMDNFDNDDNYNKVYGVKSTPNIKIYILYFIIFIFTIVPIVTNYYVAFNNQSCINDVYDVFTTLKIFTIISASVLSLFLLVTFLFNIFNYKEYAFIYKFISSILLILIFGWNCAYGINYWKKIYKIPCDDYFNKYMLYVPIYQFIECLILYSIQYLHVKK